ncbi:rhodanese-like domain protein [Thioalkalivibrio sulfidiphilus HL-EbGr7]|uniref:Rhodanese-like domain protein n=1 Tax=Thioalkalivibrio sulfidiphilus (strain HL-EbGR7) TaxID=396588 RepID=B8GUM3_THISH|nr:rhodanese-like domain-containing protein [Thioalkalivibrio sulfidiphilus]ACL73343.1 rhodanese-like domain protein [Thioalkalivibrio sulfidiphilus HL-EbGr7]
MSMTAQQLVAEARQQIQETDHDGAYALMEKDAIVLDVREPGEFEQGHLPGAVNVPRGCWSSRWASTRRSRIPMPRSWSTAAPAAAPALACVALQRMGFGKLTSLAGGFEGWVSKGQPVQKSPEAC